MRRVTVEEAKACLKNLKEWLPEKERYQEKASKGFSKGIYKTHYGYVGWSAEAYRSQRVDIVDSLTLMAKQRNWKTPSAFPCCPEKIDGDPLQCYLARMSEGAIFATNQSYESKIFKFALAKDDFIVVISEIPNGVTPFALAKITYEDGFYLHDSLGTFSGEDGAEKQFALAQGLEWTGGNTFDDYC